MSPAVFYLDRARLLAGERVLLDGAEGRHAATVRRIVVGEQVVLTDGAGLAATAKVVQAGRDSLVLDLLDLVEQARPQPCLTVVQALPKGDRGPLAVQTMTEVGVDRVVPWAAARCVTQWRDERGAKAVQGWRSAAREAAKQARRTWWPEVREPATTAQVAALLSRAELAVVLHEEAAGSLAAAAVPASGDVVLVVGPEGGLTPQEVADFEAVGALAARLGPTVLRTSTAGAVAAALVLSGTTRWS